MRTRENYLLKRRLWHKGMFKSILPLLLPLGFLTGCATISHLNLISTEQELEMGRQFSEEVDREIDLIGDRTVVTYIDHLGQLLASHSRRADIPYTFKVVDTDQVNAFALPGGYLYINRGLITTAKNESELAGVVAHEIGHVVGRHGARQISKQVGLQVLLAAVAGEAPGLSRQVASEVAGLGAGLTLLKYSREAENEADAYAVQETYDAGIDPEGAASFFEKLLALHEKEPEAKGFARLFLTHPPTQERIENVRAAITVLPPQKGLSKDSRRFQRVRAYLKKWYPEKEAEKGKK